jgi:PleD family two-component response regulator
LNKNIRRYSFNEEVLRDGNPIVVFVSLLVRHAFFPWATHRGFGMSTERRVHIVDGDESVRASLEPALQSAGFASSFYHNSASFLRKAIHPRTGCILLEMLWPSSSDDELQAVIKRLKVILPIIVLIDQRM